MPNAHTARWNHVGADLRYVRMDLKLTSARNPDTGDCGVTVVQVQLAPASYADDRQVLFMVM